MNRDGDGWAAGPDGTARWGKFGAAGLLLMTSQEDGRRVLMQHRAKWTNFGDTWALPGGARDSHESPMAAALRESAEECALDVDLITVHEELVTAGPYPGDPNRPELPGNWTYTTVIATTNTGKPISTSGNEESVELRWVPLAELETLDLMPAFAQALNALRQRVHSNFPG